MTRILLTGAGLSHNWGGWLASEAFEYLLGCPELDGRTRQLLWRSKETGGGFEDTLADLEGAADAEGKRRYLDLMAALVGMFNAMGEGFRNRRFEFRDPPQVHLMVRTFLERFDAIFTLNQDTLIELHYAPTPGGRWDGYSMPGTKPLGPSTALPISYQRTAPKQPDPTNFTLAPRTQPYIKLHGSCNWNDGPSGNRILIMGGQKAVSIDRFPLLTWYHREFRSFLARPQARLMVIGYSFSDKHINDAIGEGVERGLKLFVVDPKGVDVLDKRQKEPMGRGRDEYMDKLSPHIIGASRRPLSSIFEEDIVEHARVMKFFD